MDQTCRGGEARLTEAAAVHSSVARDRRKFPEPTSPNQEVAMPRSPTPRTERQIQVRQVTHVQASWTEQERGAPGAFTLQLILDNGAAEYVLRPTAEDADVLVKLFARSSNAMFDADRKVLMFGNLAVK